MWVPGSSSSGRPTDRLRDRGASSTIGILLMVSVTIVVFGVAVAEVSSLAAITSPTPQAAFQFDFANDGDADELVVTHHSGAEIHGDRLFVVVSDAEPGEANGEYRWDGAGLTGASTVTSGASVELNAASIGNGSSLLLDGATVELVWRSEDGNRSAVVSRWSGPDAGTATPAPANGAPTADFTYDRKGVSHNVDLNATPSTDPDGSITLYEWDIDDDGVYEETGETVKNANVPKGTSVTLRVTDDGGATDTRERTVS